VVLDFECVLYTTFPDTTFDQYQLPQVDAIHAATSALYPDWSLSQVHAFMVDTSITRLYMLMHFLVHECPILFCMNPEINPIIIMRLKYFASYGRLIH